MNKKTVQKLKLVILILVILIFIAFAIYSVIKYQKIGEKNMPYNLAKIITVSTAKKEDINEENQQGDLWNFNVIQTNDVYISIEKNPNYTKKDSKIKNVTINNIEIMQAPETGSLKAYMPNSLEGDTYNYSDEYIVGDSLTYKGAEKTNYKNLQICENGGSLSISFANKDLGKYTSGEDTEITYDGRMLSKLGLTNDKVKSKIGFDLVIELDDGKKYSGRVEQEFNCDGLVENGKSQTEITDFSNVVFKRVNK